MSVHASIGLTGEYSDPVQCHVYEDHPPILSFTDRPGYSVTVTIAPALPPERQIELADQLAAAAAEFAAAMRAHHAADGGAS